MSTVPVKRRARARPDGPASGFEAVHLERVARSAGEAFAWSGEDPAPVSRGYGSAALWLTLGAVAGVGLYVAF